MKYKVSCESRLLGVLSTNRSFAERFDGENPIFPIGGKISINQKVYEIIDFQKLLDTVNVKVVESS